MALELMLVNGDDNYLLSVHYVPDIALCALYVIYLIFTTPPGHRSGYSIFTEGTKTDRGGKENPSTRLTRGRAVMNSTSSVISIQD